MKSIAVVVLVMFAFYGCALMPPKAPPYVQSQYYKWDLPQYEGWVMMQDTGQQTTLGRSGKTKDESYISDVVLYELPDLKNEAEFLSYVKKGRQVDDDSSRFKPLVEEIYLYKGRNDYCVSFHHVSKDHKAGGQARFADNPLVREDYGYSCRLPDHKNIGINFVYSYRYIKGNQDPNLKQSADNLFQKLKF